MANETTRYFNNYFDTSALSISQNINDATLAYFESITGEKSTANILAAVVIYTSLTQGLNPMEIIDEFRKLQGAELSAYLTMFLNLNRVNTSLLGLTNTPQPSKYVSRAILP